MRTPPDVLKEQIVPALGGASPSRDPTSGFLKGVYKGSRVGFYNIGVSRDQNSPRVFCLISLRKSSNEE